VAIRYQLNLTYLRSYSDREDQDLADMDALLRNTDNQLVADTKALADTWWAGLQRDLGHMDGYEKAYRAALRQRQSSDRIYDADNSLAAAEGKVDADIGDSLILDYYIEQAR
jgi:hypothetical protein